MKRYPDSFIATCVAPTKGRPINYLCPFWSAPLFGLSAIQLIDIKATAGRSG